MTNTESTWTTASKHHAIGKWKTSADHELEFSVCELEDGTPLVTIKGPDAVLRDLFVDKVPADITTPEWASLGDRLKAADPELFRTVFEVLCEAAAHPERARACPALALTKKAA